MAVLDSPNISAISSNNLIRGIIDRPFCKCCMVVQHMVTAVIVVVAPAAVCIVATVPNIGKLCHRSWLSAVDLFQKPGINCPAVASHPAMIKIQSICNQAFVAGHDVCQVAERLRRMAFGSDMDVNTAASGGIALCSCVAQLPDQFLQCFHIRVSQDRSNHFAFFAIRPCASHADHVLYPLRPAVFS